MMSENVTSENENFQTEICDQKGVCGASTFLPFHPNSESSIYAPALSRDIITTFSMINNVAILPVLCTLGIISNSLGIAVIWHDVRRQTTSSFLYLLALAVFDILYLAACLIKVVPWVIRALEKSNYAGVNMKIGITYTTMTFMFASRAVICIWSFERLITLIRPPYVVKHTLVAKHPIKIIIYSFFLNAVLLLPIPINSEVVSEVQPGNITVNILQFYRYKHLTKIYFTSQTLIQDILPMTYLIIVSMVIPGKFYFTKAQRNLKYDMQPKRGEHRQDILTFVSIILILLYIFSAFPSTVVNALQLFSSEYKRIGTYGHVLCFTTNLSNLLSCLNAACDFVVFFTASKRFRMISRRKFCHCCDRNSVLLKDDKDMLTHTRKYDHISIFINGSRLDYRASFPEILKVRSSPEHVRVNPANAKRGVDSAGSCNGISKHYLSI